MFENKVAFVTGSTRGLGANMARRLAENGAAVAIVGRTAETGEAVAESIRSAGGRAVFVRADVGYEKDVEAAVGATVAEFGGLHIVVNNAAATEVIMTGRERPLVEQSGDDFERQIRTGAFATFYTSKYAIPHLIDAGGGAIVNISSLAGERGIKGTPGYAAAKGGMAALTRSVAIDYGPKNIRCNCVVVGPILSSEEITQFISAPGALEMIMDTTVLPNLGKSDDIAEAVLYLASDRSAFVTGATLFVDGGAAIKTQFPSMEDITERMLAAAESGTGKAE